MSLCRVTETECSTDWTPSWFHYLHGAHRDFFLDRLITMQQSIQIANLDGIPQITPIMLATGHDVASARRAFGRATWRKVHHATEQTNFMRSLVWLRFKSEASLHDIVNLQECHLRSCRNAVDWPTAQYAGQHAAQGQFARTAMIFCDVVKMGGKPDPSWPLSKLKREYEKRRIKTNISAADPTPWTTPFTHISGGFVFDRLTSDRDFAIESNVMRHCVATYQDDARTQDVFVLRCTGLERATVRCDHKGIVEITSFANGPVTQACKVAAQAAVQELLETD